MCFLLSIFFALSVSSYGSVSYIFPQIALFDMRGKKTSKSISPAAFSISIQKVLPMSSFLCYSNPQWGMDFKIILCETAFLTSLQAAFETTTLEKRACMFYSVTQSIVPSARVLPNYRRRLCACAAR